MRHIIIGSYLASFLFLFGTLIVKFQAGRLRRNLLERCILLLQAAICLNTLILYIFLYIGINMNEPAGEAVVSTYPLIMSGFFIVMFSQLLLGSVLVGLKPNKTVTAVIAAAVVLLYVYDQFYPRYDMGLHPYYSPVDYIFYLSGVIVGIMLLRKTGRKRYLTVLLIIPFIVNEQLKFIESNLQPLPVLAVLLGVIAILDTVELKRGASAVPQVESVMTELGLSERERAVAMALLGGLDNKAIADKLFISVTTVKTHLYRIYKKAGVSSRLELVQKLNGGQPQNG